MDNNPGTVPPSAPRYIMPNQMKVERGSNMTSGVTAIYPEIRGGICEWCGVIDGNVDVKETGIQQYQLCPHYRGLTLRCYYCPQGADTTEIAQHSIYRVLQHPDKPDTLLVHCNASSCKDKHAKKWQYGS